jgi:hypothetical protein
MMKPKDYLRNVLKMKDVGGRGRMPAEHKALILKAVAEGVAIEGYAVAKPALAAPKDAPVKVEKVKVSGVKEVADIPDERFPEASFRAYRHDANGKSVHVGMRTVCNTCGHSLNYNICESPVVNVDHKTTATVYIVPSSK